MLSERFRKRRFHLYQPRIHEADCHLEFARLHTAQRDRLNALKTLTCAKRLISNMGYHRRDTELVELLQQATDLPESSGHSERGQS